MEHLLLRRFQHIHPFQCTNFGVGLSIIKDKLGYENTTYAYADVSYTITLNDFDEYKLAFGLKFGASKYDLDQNLLNEGINSSDPFLDLVNFKWSPNIGAGVYFRGESFYLGISSPKLINYKNNKIEYVSLDRVSYFFNGGYLLDINSNLKFKPTFLVKYTEGAPMSMDLSTLFFVNEKLWLVALIVYSIHLEPLLILNYLMDYHWVMLMTTLHPILVPILPVHTNL